MNTRKAIKVSPAAYILTHDVTADGQKIATLDKPEGCHFWTCNLTPAGHDETLTSDHAWNDAVRSIQDGYMSFTSARRHILECLRSAA